MNAPDLSLTPAPAELVAQWTPKLRRIAWRTGIELDDLRQDAWMLAAEGVRDRDAADFVPRWLTAVHRHALALAKQRIISPPPKLRRQVEIAVGCAEHPEDDPAAVMEGQQEIARRFEGRDIEQIIAAPETAREIATATGKSERQARREKKRLEQFAAVQGDFWGAPV